MDSVDDAAFAIALDARLKDISKRRNIDLSVLREEHAESLSALNNGSGGKWNPAFTLKKLWSGLLAK